MDEINPKRPVISVTHVPETIAKKGGKLPINLHGDHHVVRVILFYCHTNQAGQWQRIDMNRSDSSYFADIPREYTADRFPLQYYFEVHTSSNHVKLFAALATDLANVPCFLMKTN